MLNDLQTIKLLYQQNLLAFTRRTFVELHPGVRFMPAPHVEAMCFAIEKAARGGCPRLLITVPPRHLKSITCSVAATAWLLGNDPRRKVLVASYGGDLAAKHSRDFRKVTAAPWFRSTFDRYEPSTSRDTQLEIETTLNGGRKAVSLGGATTGFGADFIIIDDLMKAQDARSEAARAEVRDYYDQTLFSRLNDKATGVIIAIQQRLHEDDIAAHLLDKGGFEHLNLPSIATERQFLPCYLGRTFERRVNDILAPEHMSEAALEETRRAMGSAAFSAQYQQEPTPPGGNRIKLQWFGVFDEQPERAEFQTIVQSWDTGMTEEPTSDYSVCITFGFLDNKWWILNVWRGRLAYPDLKRRAVELANKWQADRVIVEEAGTGFALVQELRREKKLRGKIFVYKPKLSKEERVEVESAKLEAGLVMLPAEAPWRGEFDRELRGFPTSKYDDQVDALTQFLEQVGRRGLNPFSGERPPGDPRLWRMQQNIRKQCATR